MTDTEVNMINEIFDITLGREKDSTYFISISIKDSLLEFEGVKTIKEKDLNIFRNKINNFLNKYIDKKLFQIDV